MAIRSNLRPLRICIFNKGLISPAPSSEQYRKYQTEGGGAKGGILGDPLGPLDWFDEPLMIHGRTPLMIHGRTEVFHDRGPRGPRNCTIGIVGTSNGNMTLIIG